MNKLEFSVSNDGILKLEQDQPDGNVTVNTYDGWFRDKTEKYITIPPGDFVMLINLYRHVKEHDIQNDYINPHGLRRE